MVKLAGKPIVVPRRSEGRCRRGRPGRITVQPAFRADLGVRMRMGEVAAVRDGGPAEKAGVKARTESPAAAGDEISVGETPAKPTARRPGSPPATSRPTTREGHGPQTRPGPASRWN